MIVPPAAFGHEFAGVLSEVAPDVRGWQVGERVVAANSAPCGTCFQCLHGQENLCDDLLFLNGAYAESIVIPARLVQKNLLRLKSDTGFPDAALVEPLACVLQGVEDLRLRAGFLSSSLAAARLLASLRAWLSAVRMSDAVPIRVVGSLPG